MTSIHKNIRAFHSDHLTVPRSMDDLKFWNIGHFQGLTMTNMNLITLGGTNYPTPQSILDADTQANLDGTQQFLIENSFIDNEQWTLTGGSPPPQSSLLLAKDPRARFVDTMSVTLSGSGLVSGTVSSTYNDDLLTGFSEPNSVYNIEFVAKDFPFPSPLTASGAGGPMFPSLSGSFMDFSSDATGNYDPSKTDSIPFTASVNNLNLPGWSKYSSLVLADTPLAYYRLNANPITSGTVLVDVMGAFNGVYDINVSPASTLTLGDSDGATFFNSSLPTAPGQFAYCTINSLPPIASVEFWIKATGGQPGGFSSFVFDPCRETPRLSQIPGFLTNYAIKLDNTGTITVSTQTTNLPSVTRVNDGQSHHVVVTYDGSTLRLYIDGLAEASRVVAITTSTGMATIGGTNSNKDKDGTNFLNGTLDELALYTTVLTQQQITNHFRAGAKTTSTFFSINRNALTITDLKNVKHVRYRLLASGNGALTYNFQALRLYKAGAYSFPQTDVDTKRGFYGRAITESGIETTATPPIWLFEPKEPKNSVQVAKFNTGTLPAIASGINNLTMYSRYRTLVTGTMSFSPPSFEAVSLSSNINQTVLTIKEAIRGGEKYVYASASGTNALTANTDYLLKTEVTESTIQATVYQDQGVFFGPQVFTSGPITLQDAPDRGYLGWQVQPYHYDFTADYIGLSNVGYGRFNSKPFASFTPVTAAQLQVSQSQPLKLASPSAFQVTGDASASAATVGTLVTRSGTGWYGGYITQSALSLPNLDEVYVSGDLYPLPGIQGEFRVVLLDSNNLVAFIASIPNLVPDKWNHFSVPIRTTIAPAGYYVLIQNTSLSKNQFLINNLAVTSPTVSWSATVDGVTYQPFYDGINDQFKGINFGTPGRSLAVRAATRSDTAWIQSYTVIPSYLS